ncbi:MAG: amidohydrolase family protein, partial [Dehalococcoidales bacterium]|nr:amidohydrolase family protein [Dehalococcoidales bacterium]
AENVIDVIATDHAPHTRVDKQREFATAPFGISMLETALGMLMGLVHDGKLDLPLIISKLTREPAAIIGNGADNLGTLKTGAFADVILIDPEKSWLVDPERFASKGKNTPLAGVRLKGKVMATFYRGNLVYKDSSLKIE